MADVIAFWVAAGLLVYVYAGYPFLIWLRGLIGRKTVRRSPIEPTVTVLVVAHNEEDRVHRRLENLLALDYPPDKMTIVLASDGSTDRTVVRARAYEDRGVTVSAADTRRGKPAVLNDVVPSVAGEIVVLADARQTFEPGALRALVANFADPAVGAVSGELIVASNSTTIGAGASFYWRYETFIRRNESLAKSTVGATGAIYAVRRELFERIPEDTILDDVLIPVRIVRRGFRVLFEPGARAYDAASTSARQEFVRKVRTIAGTFQLFARERWLLAPWRNPIWFETMSHKGLRLLTPLLHGIALGTNAALLDVPAYRWMLGAQLLFYLAAGGGYLYGRPLPTVWLRVPYTMCLMIWATIVGFLYFVTRRQQVTWERVPSTTATPRPTASRSVCG
jgi:cellulose synthase/poly-beta-1,6-N-acetylglucosamine synthase-like glycosyltransferase